MGEDLGDLEDTPRGDPTEKDGVNVEDSRNDITHVYVPHVCMYIVDYPGGDRTYKGDVRYRRKYDAQRMWESKVGLT